MVQLFNMDGTKLCSRCRNIKSANDFNHDEYARDGYQHKCNTCNVEVRQQWVKVRLNRYNEYHRNRTATNEQHRITNQIHNILNWLLKRGSYSIRTEQIMGLHKWKFLDWLVFNFENELCCSNHGEIWQFDLVTTASAFDLTSAEELLAAFKWKNIRPCFKKDNLNKYNIICPITQANQSCRVIVFERKMR